MPTDTPYGREVEAVSTQAESLAERRQVTVLFADIADFTPLSEALGEAAVFDLLQPIFEEIIRKIEEFGGGVSEFTGDGVMALFGAPRAIEDASLRACKAALAIQSRFDTISQDLIREHGVAPKFRIGIHTGPVVLGEIGASGHRAHTAVGDTVNFAARLQTLATPGRVVISDTTRTIVDGFVETSFLGKKAVKGKTGTHRVFQLNRLKPDISRFAGAHGKELSPFVGRDDELNRLEALWQTSLRGSMQLVLVTGEAGIGKSRLLCEFWRRIAIRNPTPILLDCQCQREATRTPYFPLLGALRAHAALPMEGTALEIERVLNEQFAWPGKKRAEHISYLAKLLSSVEAPSVTDSDPERVGRRTIEALCALVLMLAQETPVILQLEDIHWIDLATLHFLEELFGRPQDLPLLVLCSTRTAEARLSKVCSLRLSLGRLGRADTSAIVGFRLNGSSNSQSLITRIVERVNGNPLFAEEISQLYVHRTKNAREKAIDSRDSASFGAIELPASLEHLLLRRIDTLRPRSKEILRIAAVIGQTFEVELIHKLANESGEVSAAIRALENAGLIVPVNSDMTGGYYDFKHALIRDAVYNSILERDRRALHRGVAAAIESRHAVTLRDRSDQLAHHYRRAGELLEALPYIVWAAERSMTVYELDAAHCGFQEALMILNRHRAATDPSLVWQLLLDIARINYFRADFADTINLLEGYIDELGLSDNEPAFARLQSELGFAYLYNARPKDAKLSFERSLASSQQRRDVRTAAYAYAGLTWIHSNWQRSTPENRARALQYGEETILRGEDLGDIWLSITGAQAIGVHYLLQGAPKEVKAITDRLIDLGRRTGDHRAFLSAYWLRAFSDAYFGAVEAALFWSEKALRVAVAPLDRYSVEGIKGCALVNTPNWLVGFDILEKTVNRLEMKGANFSTQPMLIPLTIARLKKGEIAAGIAFLHDYIDLLESWGFRDELVGFFHLTLGEIYLAIALRTEKLTLRTMLRNCRFLLGAMPSARHHANQHLARAENIFRQCDARGLVAWTLIDRAKLMAHGDVKQKAREIIAEALGLAKSVEATALVERAEVLSREIA